MYRHSRFKHEHGQRGAGRAGENSEDPGRQVCLHDAGDLFILILRVL